MTESNGNHNQYVTRREHRFFGLMISLLGLGFVALAIVCGILINEISHNQTVSDARHTQSEVGITANQKQIAIVLQDLRNLTNKQSDTQKELQDIVDRRHFAICALIEGELLENTHTPDEKARLAEVSRQEKC